MRVCHCHNVSDRDIEAAVQAGARTIARVCRSTKAGTCCGGCVPAVREIVSTQSNLPLAIARSVSLPDPAVEHRVQAGARLPLEAEAFEAEAFEAAAE